MSDKNPGPHVGMNGEVVFKACQDEVRRAATMDGAARGADQDGNLIAPNDILRSFVERITWNSPRRPSVTGGGEVVVLVINARTPVPIPSLRHTKSPRRMTALKPHINHQDLRTQGCDDLCGKDKHTHDHTSLAITILRTYQRFPAWRSYWWPSRRG